MTANATKNVGETPDPLIEWRYNVHHGLELDFQYYMRPVFSRSVVAKGRRFRAKLIRGLVGLFLRSQRSSVW